MPYKCPIRRAEAALIRGRKWYANNPERARAKQVKWHKQNLEKARKQGRESERRRSERKLGYSYAEMLATQEGRCAICLQPDSGRMRNGRPMDFHVDHNHTTGKVRALLCHHCNTALGGFRDSPALLRAAATYLEGWGK